MDELDRFLRSAEGASQPLDAERVMRKAFDGVALALIQLAERDAVKLAAGQPHRVRFIEATLRFDGAYQQSLMRLGESVAGAVECRADHRRSGPEMLVTVTGREEHVPLVKRLVESLQVQAMRAMRHDRRSYVQASVFDRALTPKDKYTRGRMFLDGFASETARRLRIARREALLKQSELTQSRVNQAFAHHRAALNLWYESRR